MSHLFEYNGPQICEFLTVRPGSGSSPCTAVVCVFVCVLLCSSESCETMAACSLEAARDDGANTNTKESPEKKSLWKGHAVKTSGHWLYG